jgi:hypothetical protein
MRLFGVDGSEVVDAAAAGCAGFAASFFVVQTRPRGVPVGGSILLGDTGTATRH